MCVVPFLLKVAGGRASQASKAGGQIVELSVEVSVGGIADVCKRCIFDVLIALHGNQALNVPAELCTMQAVLPCLVLGLLCLLPHLTDVGHSHYLLRCCLNQKNRGDENR